MVNIAIVTEHGIEEVNMFVDQLCFDIYKHHLLCRRRLSRYLVYYIHTYTDRFSLKYHAYVYVYAFALINAFNVCVYCTLRYSTSSSLYNVNCRMSI